MSLLKSWGLENKRKEEEKEKEDEKILLERVESNFLLREGFSNRNFEMRSWFKWGILKVSRTGPP